jgi:hypothetical protein
VGAFETIKIAEERLSTSVNTATIKAPTAVSNKRVFQKVTVLRVFEGVHPRMVSKASWGRLQFKERKHV